MIFTHNTYFHYSKAASVQWVSQYPYENELLYTPCTSLTTQDVVEEGDTRFIKIRATLSTNRPNTESIKTVRDRDEAAAKALKRKFIMPSLLQAQPQVSKTIKISDKRRGSLDNMRQCNMSLQQFSSKGFTAEEMKQTGWFSLEEMADVYSTMQLYDAGYSVIDLANNNCESIDNKWFLKSYKAGESVQLLLNAGWELDRVKDKALILELVEKYPLEELIVLFAGLQLDDVQDKAIIVKLIKRYRLEQLEDLIDIKDIILSTIITDRKLLDEIHGKNALEQLRNFGIPGYVLRKKGVPATQLKGADYPEREIYSIEEMKALKATTKDVREKGYSEYELEQAGYVETPYKSEKKLIGHKADVKTIVEISSDTIATGGFDSSVKVWNTHKGVCKRTLRGHDNSVRCIARIDKTTLASASFDGSINVWNFESGECLRQINIAEQKQKITRLLILSTGNLLVFSAKQITIYNLSQNVIVASSSIYDWISSVAMLSNTRFVTVSPNQYIPMKIWDIKSDSSISCISERGDYRGSYYFSLCILRNGLVVSGDIKGSMVVNSPSQVDQVGRSGRQQLHDDCINEIIQLKSSSLLTCSDDKTMKIWDTSTVTTSAKLDMKCVGILHLIDSPQTGLELSDGRIAICHADGSIIIWRDRKDTVDTVDTYTKKETVWNCCRFRRNKEK